MKKLTQGDQFPSFTFNTHKRDQLNSSDVLKGKTVFWVLRYIGCTVCRYDVHLIASRYQEFINKNAQVFVVMQSDREHVINDLKNTDTELPFEIICDNDQKIYNMLCIEAAQSGEELLGNRGDDLKAKGAAARAAGFAHGDYEGNELQLPAMFIVEENGTVCYAHYAADIMDMPKVDDVLKML